MHLADRLKYLRRDAGMTQADLANKTGLGRITISNYERGYSLPGAYELYQLAEALHTSADYLLGRTDKK